MKSQHIYALFENMHPADKKKVDDASSIVSLEQLVENLVGIPQHDYANQRYIFSRIIKFASDSYGDRRRQTSGRMVGHGYEVAQIATKFSDDLVVRIAGLLHYWEEDMAEEIMTKKGIRVKIYEDNPKVDNIYKKVNFDLNIRLSEIIDKSPDYESQDVAIDATTVVSMLTRTKNYYESIGSIVSARESNINKTRAMLLKVCDSSNNISTMNPKPEFWRMQKGQRHDMKGVTPGEELKTSYVQGYNWAVFGKLLKNRYKHWRSDKGPYPTGDKVYKIWKSTIISLTFRNFKQDLKYIIDTKNDFHRSMTRYQGYVNEADPDIRHLKKSDDLQGLKSYLEQNNKLMGDVNRLKKYLRSKEKFFNDHEATEKAIKKMSSNIHSRINTKAEFVSLYMETEQYLHIIEKYNLHGEYINNSADLLNLWDEYNIDSALDGLVNRCSKAAHDIVGHLKKFHVHPKTVKKISKKALELKSLDRFTSISWKYDGIIRYNLDPQIKSKKTSKFYRYLDKIIPSRNLEVVMALRGILENYKLDKEYISLGLGLNGFSKTDWY